MPMSKTCDYEREFCESPYNEALIPSLPLKKAIQKLALKRCNFSNADISSS